MHSRFKTSTLVGPLSTRRVLKKIFYSVGAALTLSYSAVRLQASQYDNDEIVIVPAGYELKIRRLHPAVIRRKSTLLYSTCFVKIGFAIPKNPFYPDREFQRLVY